MDTKYKFSVVQESEDEDTSSTKQFVGNRYVHRRKRVIYVTIGIGICILGLALGLGLGLGLNSKQNPELNVGGTVGPLSGNGSGVTSSTKTTVPGHTSIKPSVTTTRETTTPVPEVLTTATPDGSDWIQQDCQTKEFSCPWSPGKTPPLLLVSLDGFRSEYLHRNMTPTIKKLSECGVHTPYMRATYPTLTFPNHYTIVTGLYPESHGIVDNNMYDSIINQTFSLGGSAKNNPAWWSGEPIWTTAKKQGRTTASFFWVGSDVNISGSLPDYYFPYDGKIPFQKRVDTVLSWLSWPEHLRPDFITLYFNEPDHTGHGYGPESPNVNDMLGRVDTIIKRLMDGLYARRIHNCVNIIILADHGMESTSCDRKIKLTTYIKTTDYMVFDGTIGRIQKDYKMERINRKNVVVRKPNPLSSNDLMKKLECKNEHYHAFSKADMPLRHHYMNNDRIGQIVLDVQAWWTVARSKSSYCLKGNHGYDNIYKSMHALFLAHGPGFKQNFTADPFENIELYNMMSDLLNISSAPNNGTKGSLDYVLRNPPPLTVDSATTSRTCGTTTNSSKELCGCGTGSPDMGPHETPGGNTSVSLPFGSPVVSSRDDVCQLSNKDFVTGFSHTHMSPLWTSYTLKSTKGFTLTKDNCVMLDSRLQSDMNCSSYHNDNVTHAFMFDPGFKRNVTNSRLSSNIVPMYTNFKTGIWEYLWKMVSDYVDHSKDVHVTVGPVYDHNTDGLWNPIDNSTVYTNSDKKVPFPTHFYLVLVKCKENGIGVGNCEQNNLDILTYILPHLNKVPNCLPYEDYLSQHIARIRDVEIATGLKFFSSVTQSARLKTFLPEHIWPTKVFKTHWEDLPCVTENRTSTCPGKIPLLLISLDGFKAQYIQRHITPVIEKLRTCGVHTKFMRSVYPTVTFPNHYTIVTGLYPESHGIISNKMYDEDIGKYFTLSSYTAKDPRWWGGEPIWITAQKQNKIAATYFWPGSDVNISGMYPDYYRRYSGAAGFPERVSTVLDWLTMTNESKKPDFITLYFDQPDHAGHQGGPESDLVNDALKSVDTMIGRLMDGLYQRGLHDCVNIIIIADHGFNDVSCSKVIKLNHYLGNDMNNLLISSGTFGRIQTKYHGPRKNVTKMDDPIPVSEIVRKLMCNATAMKVFTKETIPKRFHYLHNSRIGEILLDMRDEWLVTSGTYYPCKGGNHGWDNLFKSMHALFLAHGPVFKRNFEINPFENIELYNLMSDILGIKPAKNNGTEGSLDYLLRNRTSSRTAPVNHRYTPCDSGSVNLTGACSQCSGKKISVSDDSYKIISPVEADLNNTTCLLAYPNVLVGYNKQNQHPVFATTILNKAEMSVTAQTTECIVSDPRGGPSGCDDFNSENFTMSYLYHTDNMQNAEATGETGVKILPAAVPMYPAFKSGIWNFTKKLIGEYSEMYSSISITTGPIYDQDGDGLADKIPQNYVQNTSVPVPTHYFVVMIKCNDSRMNYPCGGEDNLQVQSFILPHVKNVPNCLYDAEYLRDNVARIRDIELLTGLSFFTRNYSVAASARLRTFIPVDIWPSSIVTPWLELPCSRDACPSDYHPLLLISLDGYRADYLLRNFTPYIRKLSHCGVHAPYMRSVYPTKTFPNHYSIVTGLYPESHGIIDNSMYDTNIQKKFSLGKSSSFDSRWWGGEPIWNTAKKQNRSTATYFWPGSDVEIQGLRPDYWKKYDGSVLYDVRVKQILDWVSLPNDKRPEFMTLYFDEPDHSGHQFGPDDIPHIGLALERVDLAIGQLMEGLYHKGLHNCVNVIIVADHGMSEISCDRLISFGDFLSSTRNMQIYEGAFSRIDNKHRYKSSVSLADVQIPVPVKDIMKNLTCGSPHFKVFRKEDLPKRHHYANNHRIDDIIVDVQDSWLVTYRSLKSYNKKYCTGGNHGYDNTYRTMNALFLASGPAFKRNITIEPFENIELYNLMAEILQIEPTPNNGTRGRLNHILSNHRPLPASIPLQNYSTANTSSQMESIPNVANLTQRCPSSCQIPTNISHQTEDSGLENTHLPLGRPEIMFTNNITKLYIHHEFTHISAYISSLIVPAWVSYTLNKSQVTGIQQYPSCLVRGGSNPQCESTTVNGTFVWTPLYRAGMSSTVRTLLSQNFVPMLKTFRSGVWDWLQNRTSQYAEEYGQVNVITGPIYDYDIDGHADDPAVINKMFETLNKPSHFFYILSRCKDKTNLSPTCDAIQTLSFIIPHKETVMNCQSVENYLLDNVARIRDIELLTGLQFFPVYGLSSGSTFNSIRMRTALFSTWW